MGASIFSGQDQKRANAAEHGRSKDYGGDHTGIAPLAQPDRSAPIFQGNRRESIVYESSCGKTIDKDEADLCEQKRQASAAEDAVVWARRQFIAGILGLAAVVLTLVLNFQGTSAATRGVEVAERQAEISRQAMIADIRPYISIKSIALVENIRREENGIHFALDFFYENGGKTPAVAVSIHFAVTSDLMQAETILEAVQATPHRPPGIGNTVAGGANVHNQLGIYVSPESLKIEIGDIDITMLCSVYRWITYQRMESDEIFYTTFNLWLQKMDGSWVGFDMDDPSFSIAPDEIKLVALPVGWHVN